MSLHPLPFGSARQMRPRPMPDLLVCIVPSSRSSNHVSSKPEREVRTSQPPCSATGRSPSSSLSGRRGGPPKRLEGVLTAQIVWPHRAPPLAPRHSGGDQLR
eukprot:scaffold40081_cov32-Tisochrysis_lutea.AAC.2